MKPRIVVFCCANSTVAPEEHVDKIILENGADIRMVRLPCTGRTDVLNILKTIEDGADMALIVGCPEGECRFLEGNRRAGMRVRYANRLLSEAGLGKERVRMYNMSPAEPGLFSAALSEAVQKARELGPWLRRGL